MFFFNILILFLVGCSFASTDIRESEALEEVPKFEVILQRSVTTVLFFFVVFVTAVITTSMLPFTYLFGFYFGRLFVAPAFKYVFENL